MIDAQTFLAALPGKRVTVVSNGTTVFNVLRSGRRGEGRISDSGLDFVPQTAIYPLTGAFGKEATIADFATVDGIPAYFSSVDHINEETIDRIAVALLADTCKIDGADVACQVGAVSRSTDIMLGGLQQDDAETLTTHVQCLPDGAATPKPGAVVVLPDGKSRGVRSVSADNTGRVLTITLRKTGGVV